MVDSIPWSHTFDFTKGESGWGSVFEAAYSAGAWRSNYQNNNTSLVIGIDFDSTILTSIRVVYTATNDANGGGRTVQSPYGFAGTPGPVIGNLDTGHASMDTTVVLQNLVATKLGIDVSSNSTGTNGENTITKVVITGIGLNPFLKHKGPKDCPFCDAAIGAEEGGG